MQENQQEKQPQKNYCNRLLGVILIALVWVVFAFVLLMCSSKCSKATSFTDSAVTYNEGQKLDCTGLSSSYVIIGNSNNVFAVTRVASGGSVEYYNGGTLSGNVITFGYYYNITASQSTSAGPTNANSYTLTINSNNAVLHMGFFNYTCNVPSSGGFTQQDLDDAYAEGQLDALNVASASTYGSGTTYTSYSDYRMTSEMTTAYAEGITHVTNNPDDYNLYTSSEYNSYGSQQYNQGELDALNVASASTYGSGTTYTSYSDNSIRSEMSSAYSNGNTAGSNTGRLQVLQMVSNYDDNVTGGTGTGTIYNTFSTTDLINELSSISTTSYNSGYSASSAPSAYAEGQLYVLNRVSDYQYDYCINHNGTSCTDSDYDSYTDSSLDNLLTLLSLKAQLYGGDSRLLAEANIISHNIGSGTTYTDLDDAEGALLDEIDYLVNTASNRSFASGQLIVLNTVASYSPPDIGSGTTYTSYDTYDLFNEISGIYANGIANGSENASNYQTGYQDAISAVRDCPSCFDYVPLDTYNTDIDLAEANSYSAGYHDGINTDSANLPNAIVAVASVPHVVLSSLLGFEVLGVNLWVFFTGIIGLLLVIWLIKHFWK